MKRIRRLPHSVVLLLATAHCADDRAQVGVVEPLMLIAASPSDGASGVGVGAQLAATFSRDVDTSTLADGLGLEAAGGAPVAATVTYDAARFTATLTPDSPLAYSATYALVLRESLAAADGRLLGNDGVITFETEDPPPLELVSSSPADGAEDVPQAAVFTFVFSEDVDPATVTAGSLHLADTAPGGGAIAGTAAVDGAVVTFTPDQELAYSSRIEVTLESTLASARATPRGGQLAGAPVTVTAGVVHPPPLFVVAATPSAGAPAASVGAPVVVYFSVALDPASAVASAPPDPLDTVRLASSAGAVPVSLDVLGDVLVITPADASAFGTDLLAYDTEYTLTLAGSLASLDAAPARSEIGTLVSDSAIVFRTAPPPALELLLASPANGAVQSGLSDPIELVFSEPVDPASFTAAGAIALTDDGGNGVAGIAVSTNGAVVTVSHASLARSTPYTLRLAPTLASERSGMLAARDAIAPACGEDGARCVHFTTLALEPLRIVRTSPPNLAVGVDPSLAPEGAILVTFSGDVSPASICAVPWDPAAGPCTDPSARVFVNAGADPAPAARLPASLAYTNDGATYAAASAAGPYVLAITVQLPLADAESYVVTVEGCADESCASPGVVPADAASFTPLVADYYSRFRTRHAPGLAWVDPGHDPTCAHPVSTASAVTATFTTDIDCAGVTFGAEGTLRISYVDMFGLERFVSGDVTCDGVDPLTGEPSETATYASNRLTVVPALAQHAPLHGEHGLVPDSGYQMVFTTGILDTAGEPALPAAVTTAFCTGGAMQVVAAVATNGVVSVADLSSAESIPVDSDLVLTFDREVAPATAFADPAGPASVVVTLVAVDATQAENNLGKCVAGAIETVSLTAHPDDPTKLVLRAPDDAYCYGARYRVTLRGGDAAGTLPGLEGTDGVPMAQNAVIDFATDPGNREVLSVYNFPDGTTVPCGTLTSLVENSNIEVFFERPIDPLSVTADAVYVEEATGAWRLGFLPVLSADGRVLSLAPSPELVGGVSLVFVIGRALRDERGNPFPDRASDRCLTAPAPEPGFAALFTSASNQSFGNICWVGSEPAAGGIADRGSVLPRVRIRDSQAHPNGILAQNLTCDSIVLRRRDAPETNLCAHVNYVAGDCSGSYCEAIVRPRFDAMLDHGVDYEIVVNQQPEPKIVNLSLVGFSGVGGCPNPPAAIAFRVDDGHTTGTYAPGTVTLSPNDTDYPAGAPVSGRLLTLTFDRDLRPGSVTAATLLVSDGGGGAISGTIEVAGAGACGALPCISNQVRFTAAADLPGPDATVIVRALAGASCGVDGVCDAAGHPLDTEVQLGFRTSFQAPAVEDVTQDGATVVIAMSALDPIEPASVSTTTAGPMPGNVRLFDVTGSAIEVFGWAEVDGFDIRFWPMGALTTGGAYEVRVGTGATCEALTAIEDIAGNAQSDCSVTALTAN